MAKTMSNFPNIKVNLKYKIQTKEIIERDVCIKKIVLPPKQNLFIKKWLFW